MAVPHHDGERVHGEPLLLDAVDRRIDADRADHQVERSVQQPFHAFLEHRFVHPDRERRQLPPELPERARHQRRGRDGGAPTTSGPKEACRSRSISSIARPICVCRIRACRTRTSPVSVSAAPERPRQDLGVQPLLQRGDAVGQRRLRHPQLCRSAAEAAGLRRSQADRSADGNRVPLAHSMEMSLLIFDINGSPDVNRGEITINSGRLSLSASPERIHLVGSIGLDNAQEVFRTVGVGLEPQ